jgi:FtsH-binding integral membrane protein
MSTLPQPGFQPIELGYARDDRATFSFFNTVYAWMCVGLTVTGIVAWLVSKNLSLLLTIHTRGIAIAFLLGGVLICWGIRAAARNINPTVATVLFLVYAAIVGAMLSGIFVVYRLQAITSVFIITGGTFGGMSVFGFVTKRDLTRIGAICIMFVWGLFLAAIVNIFLQSAMLSYVMSFIGVAVFTALTAYDTQKLKLIAEQTASNPSMAARYAIIGSLELYLDFINLFIFLLRILGKRR